MEITVKASTSQRTRPLAFFLYAISTIALLAQVGCTKTAAPALQTAPRSDQQVATDIQGKLAAESALSGQNVRVDVQGGVATLNGAVSDNASRALAGNDAGSVDGVKTVVNNLTVQSASAAGPMLPRPAPQQYIDRKSESRSANGNGNDRRTRNSQGKYSAGQSQGGDQASSDQYPANQNTNQSTPLPTNNSQAPSPNYPSTQPGQAPPPARPAAVSVTLPEGTVLPVRISEALDSSQAQANDVFHGAIAQDLVADGMVAVSRGASVMGRIVDARDAAHFKGSSLLSIEVTQLTSHGRQVSVVTEAYTKEGQGRGKNTAEKAGGGAALGAIIGAIAGGGKGAAIGAAAGGGIGAGANGVTRGQQVQIPSESVVNFRLQSPITVVTSRRVGMPRSSEQDTPRPTLEQR